MIVQVIYGQFLSSEECVFKLLIHRILTSCRETKTPGRWCFVREVLLTLPSSPRKHDLTWISGLC